jgi:hypothetical protein
MRINSNADTFIDLSIAKATAHAHTTAGVAEQVTLFDDNALIRIWCASAVWVGGSKAEAESHAYGTPANVPMVVRLNSRELWIDTANSAVVSCNQVTEIS